MIKNDYNLRREKLRNLLLQEMEGYQYEVYNNNGSQYLLDKFNTFNNNNNANRSNVETNSYNFNNYTNSQSQNQQGQNNIINNIQFNNNNISSNNQNNLNQQNNNQIFNNNGNTNNNYNYYQNEQINNLYSNQGNFNNEGNYNYGNSDIDAQISNYNAHYNKLKVDEFMSKKIIQDDLLNKINQKLMKINKNIDDKAYQENLAAQWQQNHPNP